MCVAKTKASLFSHMQKAGFLTTRLKCSKVWQYSNRVYENVNTFYLLSTSKILFSMDAPHSV